MKTMLIRRVNGRLRYYLIEMFENLFNEWMVVRTYGSCERSRPTGFICEVYGSNKESAHAYQTWITTKTKKGYRIINKRGGNR